MGCDERGVAVKFHTAELGSMALVSLIEPVFQVTAGFSGEVAIWAQAYVGVHVWAINVLQLRAFRRYGFAAMLAFRLVYYLHWHVLWGHVRLQILF